MSSSPLIEREKDYFSNSYDIATTNEEQLAREQLSSHNYLSQYLTSNTYDNQLNPEMNYGNCYNKNDSTGLDQARYFNYYNKNKLHDRSDLQPQNNQHTNKFYLVIY